MADNDRPQTVVQGATQVATGAIDALKGSPMAIGLLLINLMFIGFTIYVLGEISANSVERNKTQAELITSLVKEIRDCHTALQKSELGKSLLYRDRWVPWERSK